MKQESTIDKTESSVHKTVGATSESKVSQRAATLEFSQIPKKYRRRPLTQEEIDLVSVCIIFFFLSIKIIYEKLFFFSFIDWWFYVILLLERCTVVRIDKPNLFNISVCTLSFFFSIIKTRIYRKRGLYIISLSFESELNTLNARVIL